MRSEAEEQGLIERRKDIGRATRAGLGSVARKGAAEVRKPGPPRSGLDRGRPERDPGDTWIDEGSVRRTAQRAVKSASAGASPARSAVGEPKHVSRSTRRLPEDVVGELDRIVGTKRAPRLAERLTEARDAFEHERYGEARSILSKLAVEAPAAAAVRELYGLTLYRMERWKLAAAELEAYRLLTSEPDQLPVLADCYRALKRFDDIDDLWADLRAASPSAEIVTEGRIVVAGALADRNRLAEAISVLEQGVRPTKRVQERHMRLWYALADLYDRAGDVPRAKSLFARLASEDPDFADVPARLAALGR